MKKIFISQNKAFSLIELLISIFLSAGILISLYFVYKTSINTFEKRNNVIEVNQKISNIKIFLDKLFTQKVIIKNKQEFYFIINKNINKLIFKDNKILYNNQILLNNIKTKILINKKIINIIITYKNKKYKLVFKL